METRLDKDRFENLYSNLPFQNKIIVKHPNASGGLLEYLKTFVEKL